MEKIGWIKSIRKSKDITFVGATTGQKDYQVTLTSDTVIEGDLKVGASFLVIGKDSITPKGMYEFLASSLRIVGQSDDSYPIQPKHHTFDFLRTLPGLRGRTKTFQAIWQLRHHLIYSIHTYLMEREYIQYTTPIITLSDCEGAGETFTVKTDWMEEKLTVSGQLHLEVGMMSLGKVYEISPCFRAEKSSTKKHLSEFWMLECEGIGEMEEYMLLTEGLLKTVLGLIMEKEELFGSLGIDTSHIVDITEKQWAKIGYIEVCEKYGIRFGDDISSEIEARIVKDFSCPVFITDYAKGLKPFYMKKGQYTAKCFDLIFPEVGELVGGSQREEEYDVLKSEMEKSGLDMEKMGWYLDTRKWGSIRHSGFGLGIDRLVMFVCKLQKIHDAIPFPISY